MENVTTTISLDIRPTIKYFFNVIGNHLGELTDDVEELMIDIGRIAALAPFDENEEPESEDEDTDDNDDGDDENTSLNNNQDDNDTDDVALQIKGIGLTNDSPLLKDNVTNGEATEVSFLFLCLYFFIVLN